MDTQIESYKRNILLQLSKESKATYSFTTFSKIHSELIYQLLSRALGQYQLNFLENAMMTFSKELLNNAVKANLKRAFFHTHGVELNDQKYYYKTLADFRKVCLGQMDDYTKTLTQLGLKVSFCIFIKPEGIHLSIQNNAAIIPQEASSIRQQLQYAKVMTSLSDAFETDDDEKNKEGGGLGLLLSLMLVKQVGIALDSFKIASNQKCTQASLFIPKNISKLEAAQELQDRITNEIQDLPTFPETIHKILTLCDDIDAHTSKISQEVGKDPSVSAGLLRIANSGAFYISPSRIDNIPKAIAMIGLKNLKQIVMCHASYAILENNYKLFKNFHTHAEQCGNYARRIAELTNNKNIADTVCLGGLLHDIGKILLYSIEPERVRQLSNISAGRNSGATTTLEEISFGISHTEVGAKLAEKWQFAENIVEMIRYHHSPFAASQEFIKEVSIIHLADIFLKADKKQKNMIYPDIEAQAALEITSDKDVNALRAKVRAY